jgi:hypothetical protein
VQIRTGHHTQLFHARASEYSEGCIFDNGCSIVIIPA